MAESENMLLRAYAQIDDGKAVAYVRAAQIVNARPEAGRLIIRMRNDAEVGLDAMPGAFAKRTPQTDDYYVVFPDGHAVCMALPDFLRQFRPISDHEIPGAPAPLAAGASASPALHRAIDPDGDVPAFAAAPPTTMPPLSHWINPEDAPKDPRLPSPGPIAPPRAPDDPSPPPATPIDLLVEREGKADPNVEQPALSGGFVSVEGPMTPRDEKLIEAHQFEAKDATERGDDQVEADPGFGKYSPDAMPAGPDRSAAEYEHSTPTEVPQDQVAPAAPSPEPPVSAAGDQVGPTAPANDHSSIQYRDPTAIEPEPAGTVDATSVHPAKPTDSEGKADEAKAPQTAPEG